MELIITRIGGPVTATLRDNIRQSRFPVEFESTECAGKAFLCVIHSSPSIDMQSIRKQVLGHAFDFSLDMEKIRAFKKVLADGRERMVPLGPPGAFEFEGRLASVLMT